MLPVNKRYPIDDLLEVCREYIAVTGRRITFEWALVNEINDSPGQAHLLAKKIKGMLCHVNAIPLNPTRGYSGQATTRERADKFKDILIMNGIPCTIRLRRGIDIQAGCGQLASGIYILIYYYLFINCGYMATRYLNRNTSLACQIDYFEVSSNYQFFITGIIA